MFCPGSVRDFFIDTGIQIEWYGAVIICQECVTAMGQQFRMLSEGQAELLRSALAESDNTIYELQKRLAALEGVQDALVAGGWVAPDSARVLDVPSSDDEGPSVDASTEGGDVGTERGETPQSVHDAALARLRPNVSGDAVLNL